MISENHTETGDFCMQQDERLRFRFYHKILINNSSSDSD